MTTSATDNDRAVQNAIERRAHTLISLDDARTLRRAELTLTRWAERHCNGEIEYDEDAGIWCAVSPVDRLVRYKVPNLEAGALKRIQDVCERNGLHWFHQTDPRGCALYVHNEPLPCNDYTRGVAILNRPR